MTATQPRTEALRRILDRTPDRATAADLAYLEAWEVEPQPGSGPALRVAQLRRANPLLAAEIRAELQQGRPLTGSERAALAA